MSYIGRLMSIINQLWYAKLQNGALFGAIKLGDVAAVVRSSTISPLNNRTNKRNKERGVKTIELLHIAVQ